MKRFQLIQVYENYRDYDTTLGGAQGTDADEVKGENVRRLTFDTNTHKAYLIMRDFTEKVVPWEDAETMLLEDEMESKS